MGIVLGVAATTLAAPAPHGASSLEPAVHAAARGERLLTAALPPVATATSE